MNTVKFLAFGIAICFFGLAPACCIGAVISGPDSVEVGELATFTADIEGDAIVMPAKGISIAKDSNRKAIYLAAQKEGEYTIIFFSVENGNPVITQKALTVGEVSPEPRTPAEPGTRTGP